MIITVNVRLASSKESDYVFNVDLDSEGRFNQRDVISGPKAPKIELGGIQRPDADRLRILKSPALAAEDADTTKVMDELELS